MKSLVTFSLISLIPFDSEARRSTIVPRLNIWEITPFLLSNLLGMSG